MRRGPKRCLIDLEGVGSRGSWGALKCCNSRHGNAGSVYISANSYSRLGPYESTGV